MKKVKELNLVDLGEVSADTTRSVSTGKFEILVEEPKKAQTETKK